MRKNPISRLSYNFLLALASSVIGTIILSWPLLAVFIQLQKTAALVHQPLSVIMHNYTQLLVYLLWPFEKVLKMTNFPTSPSAATHFYECKLLFQLALVVFLFGVILSGYAHWRHEKHFMMLNKTEALILMLVPFIVLPFAMTNFDRFFVVFHELLFSNTTWLFNPQTDPIIDVLTEGFFAACFACAGVIYELFFARFLLKGK